MYYLLIVVSQIRSIDDSKDVDESMDVDEVCTLLGMCVLLFYGCQGLLDGDSSMEDGEVEREVSVSVKFIV